MLARLIEWSVENRFLVLLGAAFGVGAGIWAVGTTPVDAIPDLSDVQVIVQTEWAEQAPQIVEDQVTYPLTTALLAVPGATTVRGISGFGISYVYVLFAERTDPYWARSRVLEYLSQVREALPAGVAPQLGPDATGVGWVYQYTVESDRHDLVELRSLQDFFVRYQLQSVPGVAEVATVGGWVKQYQVDVDPQRLEAYGIPIGRVSEALRMANADAGARVLELSGREYMVRGLGYLQSVEDIEGVVVGVGAGGTPVRVQDVGRVQVGPDLRRGVADKDGQGDVVTGIVVMRHGENALEVIDGVKRRMEEIRAGLPEGVRLVDAYDRAPLIRAAVANLGRTIVQVLLLTALIASVFLLHLRSSLVVVATLPVAVLGAFIVMRAIGVQANIMSLAGIAIAIGAMVDAGVVLIDNLHKHLEREPDPVSPERRWELVARSSKEVGPAIFFSLLVVTVSFLPVFALEAQEGRLFRPLAWTKTLAMASAAVLAVTLIPVTLGYFVRGRVRSERANPVSRALTGAYRPVLGMALRHRWVVLAGAVAVLALTLFPLRRLGSEFMPPVEEGTLLFMPMTLPGVSIQQAQEIMRQQNAAIAAFPEVESVIGKAGRANTATDPAPLDMFETVVNLKPAAEWRPGLTWDALVSELDRATRMPGVTNIWTMPIRNRIDMLATGMRTPLGLKVFGPDPGELQRIGTEVEALLRHVPGTRGVVAERSASGFYLDVAIDRAAAARYGLNVMDVQDALMAAVGGTVTTHTVEGRERYGVLVRYPRDLRQRVGSVSGVRVATMDGRAQVPLGQVATVRVAEGPMAVRTENAFPVSAVYVDVEGRDLGGYVNDARELLAERLALPAGYTLQWSGQFEAMERVRKRLTLIVPVTVALVFLLLFLHFRSAAQTLMVLSTLPFALVGGVWLLWLLDLDTSVAVGVGFIALAGLAAEMGVVMLIYLDQAFQRHVEERPEAGAEQVLAATLEGAAGRVRPVLMTVVSDVGGLLPLLWVGGVGAATMRRIAAPVVGGLLTAMVLALIVIPVVYSLWREAQLRRRRTGAGTEATEALAGPVPSAEPGELQPVRA